MRWKNYTVLSLVSLLVGVALFGLNFSNAQQMPPNPANEKSASPAPTVSPSPEVIEEDDDVIKIDTEAVNVLFTAQDKNRRLLTTLTQADIRILEDGQPQEITAFSRQIDLPLSLAILIDTSASQERTLPEERLAAKAFVQSVIRPAKDEVSIISFTGETTLEQGMTNNLARLNRAIDKVEFVPPAGYIGGGVVAGTPPISGDNQMSQGSTAIWDAIWVTSEEVLKVAPEKTRRAIILLSDGVNTFGSKKFDDAVQAALRSEAVIYSIGVGDDFYGGVDEGVLKKLSERTGGRAFFPRDESQLRKAFAQIQDELRSQYLIAYEPANQKRDGSYRKIQIQIVNQELAKQKITLTHRQGYFAQITKPAGK
jgi:Ca-activated chloride channel homolog